MTRKRADPEPGDWIVYVGGSSGGSYPSATRTIGGPYIAGLLVEKLQNNWRVKPQRGPDILVPFGALRVVVLTRGEADLLVDKLRTLQHQYAVERDTLQPKFLQRVADVLANA